MAVGVGDLEGERSGRAVHPSGQCRDRVEHAHPEVVDDVADRDRPRVLEQPRHRLVD
jgi:hypothetical protein